MNSITVNNLITNTIAIMRFNLYYANFDNKQPINIMNSIRTPLIITNNKYFNGIDNWFKEIIEDIRPTTNDARYVNCYMPSTPNESIMSSISSNGFFYNISEFVIYIGNLIVDFELLNDDTVDISIKQEMLMTLHKFLFIMIQLSTFNNLPIRAYAIRWTITFNMIIAPSNAINKQQILLELPNINFAIRSLCSSKIQTTPISYITDFNYFSIYNTKSIDTDNFIPKTYGLAIVEYS